MEKLNFYPVVRDFPHSPLADDTTLCEEVRREVERLISDYPRKITGKRVAICVGSRGIWRINLIVREIVRAFRAEGAKPFIVPAMGSHGGGTAEGNIRQLAALGVTESFVNAPFAPNMETESLGNMTVRGQDGSSVSVDVQVAQSVLDGCLVFLVNRIKIHTEFDGHRCASGLQKMSVIGLAKLHARDYHKAAIALGSEESPDLESVIRTVSRLVRTEVPIMGGLGLVENERHQILMAYGMLNADIPKCENALLSAAKESFPRLPRELFAADAAIVLWVGKNISGYGACSQVLGAGMPPSPTRPTIKRRVYLRLDDGSVGNALGVGLADYLPQTFIDQIDWPVTALNVETTGRPILGQLPKHIEPTEQRAIEATLEGLGPNPVVVFIQSTLRMNIIWVSEAGVRLLKDPSYQIGEPQELTFDENGMLTGPGFQVEVGK